MTEMTTSEQLTLLGLLVALSAYLSAIRLSALEKISEANRFIEKYKDCTSEEHNSDCIHYQKRKREITNKLWVLTFAEAPLVIASVLLGWHVISPFMKIEECVPSILNFVMYLAALAGIVMGILHAVAWYKTWEIILTRKKNVDKNVDKNVEDSVEDSVE